MDCFMGLVAMLFFVFTSALCLLGIGVFTMAVYIQVRYDYIYAAADVHSLSYASIIVMVIAGFLVVLGFLGCYGTCRQSKWMLYLFGLLLSIMLVAEVAVAVFCIVERTEVNSRVQSGLQKSAEQYMNDATTVAAWNTLQREYHCCGVDDGPSDWFQIFSNPNITHATPTPGDDYFPSSCCQKSDDDDDDQRCGVETVKCPGSNKDAKNCVLASSVDPKLYYQKPCAQKADEDVKTYLLYFAAGGFIFAFLQLLGVFAACSIGADVKRKDSANEYA